MNEAEQFFYDHAGYSHDPKRETEEEGRVRCAVGLAAAEVRLKDGPYFIDMQPDPNGWDADVPYDGPVWVVTLYGVAGSLNSEHLGSLGGVAATGWSDPYVRVVAAELASEYISENEEAGE